MRERKLAKQLVGAPSTRVYDGQHHRPDSSEFVVFNFDQIRFGIPMHQEGLEKIARLMREKPHHNGFVDGFPKWNKLTAMLNEELDVLRNAFLGMGITYNSPSQIVIGPILLKTIPGTVFQATQSNPEWLKEHIDIACTFGESSAPWKHRAFEEQNQDWMRQEPFVQNPFGLPTHDKRLETNSENCSWFVSATTAKGAAYMLCATAGVLAPGTGTCCDLAQARGMMPWDYVQIVGRFQDVDSNGPGKDWWKCFMGMNSISLSPQGANAIFPDLRHSRLVGHGEQGNHGGPFFLYEAQRDSGSHADGKTSDGWFANMFGDGNPFTNESNKSCLLGVDDSTRVYRDAKRALSDGTKVSPTLLPPTNAQVVAIVFRPGDAKTFASHIENAKLARDGYRNSLQQWAKHCQEHRVWFTQCNTMLGEHTSGVFQFDVGPSSGHWKDT